MLVRIFHNVAQDAEGRNLGYYGIDPQHEFTLVFAYDDDDVPDPMCQLEDAYHAFNVGDDPDFGTPQRRAIEYRKRRNRSLCVGDVVALDEQLWTCAASGWERVTFDLNVTNVRRHGSVPLHATLED